MGSADLNRVRMWVCSWTYWQFKSYNDITTQASFHNYTTESFYGPDGTLELDKVLATPFWRERHTADGMPPGGSHE